MKKFDFTSLREDAELDSKFRDQATRAYERIYGLLRQKTSKYVYERLENLQNPEPGAEVLAISLSDYAKEYEGLYLYFCFKVEDDLGKFFTNPKGQKFIVLYCIDERDADEILNLIKDPSYKRNYYISWLYDNRRTFIHEYVHYLDHLRRKGQDLMGTANLDFKSWANTPEEFNANFQALAWGVESELKRGRGGWRPEDKEKFLSTPQKFVDFIVNHSFYMSSVIFKSFDQKYKQKFLKRLYGLQEYLWNKYKDENE